MGFCPTDPHSVKRRDLFKIEKIKRRSEDSFGGSIYQGAKEGFGFPFKLNLPKLTKTQSRYSDYSETRAESQNSGPKSSGKTNNNNKGSRLGRLLSPLLAKQPARSEP